MTEMYLLYEWTEEREAKDLIGIYSTVEKAKKVVELIEDFAPVSWTEERMPDGTLYAEVGVATDEEYPYEILLFNVDTYKQYKYGPGTDNPTTTHYEF